MRLMTFKSWYSKLLSYYLQFVVFDILITTNVLDSISEEIGP